MGILRTDRVSGLGGANAIKGSVLFSEKQYFIINNHEDFQFGTGDWTIEYWWNGHPNGGYNSVITTMITSNESGTWRVGHTFSGNNRIYFARGTGSGFTDVTFNVDVNDNKWHHIAFVRSSGTIIPFVDGVDKTADKTSGSVSDGNNMTTTNRVSIGFNDRDNDYIHGHVSNLRVIKGTALYTSNFTPPTGELQKLSGTSLLCFQSPGNILQEETGKILQPFRDGSSAGDQSGSNSTFAVATRFTPNSPVGFSTTTDVGTQFGSTFDGVTTFDSQAYMVPPGGNTRERNRGRGLVGGGWSPSLLAQIYSVEIQSDGTSADFGDLTDARRGTGAAASATRAVWAGGYSPGYVDVMDFVTIASTANALDFGNLDFGRFETSGLGNDTRGVFGPSENPAQSQNVIQFITFATTGNATDFGDSTVQTKKQASMCSNTRGLFAGGQNLPSPTAYLDIIDKITIATTGNAADFGDLTQNVFMCTGVSDSTRGIRGGGAKSPSPANTDTIDFVTIASDGNATDFGNLTTANQRSGGMSNKTRGLFSGGATPDASTAVNSIDKITIQSTGNAVDFGDYTGTAVTQAAGCSDSHGGLS